MQYSCQLKPYYYNKSVKNLLVSSVVINLRSTRLDYWMTSTSSSARGLRFIQTVVLEYQIYFLLFNWLFCKGEYFNNEVMRIFVKLVYHIYCVSYPDNEMAVFQNNVDDILT